MFFHSVSLSVSVYPIVLIVTLNIHVHLKIFNFLCPFVTNHPADHCYIVLQWKMFMFSAWMSFILYTSCCYIYMNQNTQVILPECFSISLLHLIFSSMRLSIFHDCGNFLFHISQPSPAVPFCLSRKATTVAISSCIINYFMNLLHEQLYFPLHKFWSMAAVQYMVTSIFLNILPWTFRVPLIHILHWSILVYAQVTYLFGIWCCKYTYLLIQTHHNVEHLYIQDFLGSLYVILCVWICMSMYVCMYVCTYAHTVVFIKFPYDRILPCVLCVTQFAMCAVCHTVCHVCCVSHSLPCVLCVTQFAMTVFSLTAV